MPVSPRFKAARIASVEEQEVILSDIYKKLKQMKTTGVEGSTSKFVNSIYQKMDTYGLEELEVHCVHFCPSNITIEVDRENSTLLIHIEDKQLTTT